MVKDLLEERARGLGFLVAWAPLALPEEVKARFLAWLRSGRHAGMAYLARHPEVRLDPALRFPARSALLLAAPHAYPDPGRPPGGVRLGRVARYAWARDYHLLLEPHLRALEEVARGLGLWARGYVDHGPLPERSLAALAGLGFIGRSGMLIRVGGGSYLSLAVLLTDLPPPPPAPVPGRCGRCVRCLAACPTNALLGDGTLDARRCVSYWTIEHRGAIPYPFWDGVGEWLFGCDLCQEACPWNRFGSVWTGFRPEPDLAHPDLQDFFQLSGRAFGRKYAGTAFLRPGRARMARNALIVLANLGEGLGLIRQGLSDPHPLVRLTALQAAHRVGRPDWGRRLLLDPDPRVAREARRLWRGEPPSPVDLFQDEGEAPGP
ncbi:tRNA epoxyqueuosine(34) reductase QueG [Thermus filiformis]|uniref:(Fe-S)-binding protein n=1 Tax=Thermus filiformis TaxID=276 RepID=A0A0A2X767_THEFI|nr:tRNA epoxyqueuosine(34) reductase QueG [Thermus filiformis]KGQ21069.2 (Fe-S)-binding protein [Thermus filiformis]